MHLRFFAFDGLFRIDRQPQQFIFFPGAADGLHADGQSIFCVTDRERYGGQSGHVASSDEAHDLHGGGQVRIAVG